MDGQVDAIVFHASLEAVARAVAERLQIPCVGVRTSPFLSTPSSALLPPQPSLGEHTSRGNLALEEIRAALDLPHGARAEPALWLYLASRVLLPDLASAQKGGVTSVITGAFPSADGVPRQLSANDLHLAHAPHLAHPQLSAHSQLSAHAPLSEEVERFLTAGGPPVLFAMGALPRISPALLSTASVALEQLDLRGIILGHLPEHVPSGTIQGDVLLLSAAPLRQLLPRCCSVVSPGDPYSLHGALRAARPLVVCPAFGDHASWATRAAQLGVCPAEWLPLSEVLSGGDALRELIDQSLLPNVAATAAAAAAAMEEEGDAATNAADALEGALRASGVIPLQEQIKV